MIIKCRKTVKDNLKNIIFTKDKTYEFIPVYDKYSRQNNFIGYFDKDDEQRLRWSTAQFKDEYFIELD